MYLNYNNRKNHCSRLVLILSLCISSFAKGENLLDVYRDALSNDPTYAMAQSSMDMSMGDREIARAGLLPTISLTGMSTSNRRRYLEQSSFPTRFSNSNWQAGISQPLFDLEAWHGFKEADSASKRAQWMLVGENQELIIRTVETYLDVVLAENELRAILAEEKAVLQQLEEVQKRYDAGLIAVVDVLEAQAIADSTAVRRAQAQSNKEAAFSNMKALTSYSYKRLDGIGNDLPAKPASPRNRDVWIARALETSPAIKAATEEVEIAHRSLRKSSAARWPTINALLQQQSTQANDDPALGIGFNETFIGIGFRWTPYQGGRVSGMRERARARITQTEAQLRRTRLETDRDISVLLRQIDSDVEQLTSGSQAIQSASKALSAVTVGYDSGSRDLLDILQAQQRLNAAQYDQAKASHSYLLNLIRLKAAAGSLSEDDIRQINLYCDAQLPVWREGSTEFDIESKKSGTNWQLNKLND